MTTPLQYPLINGIRHGFANIELKLAGQIFVGFKSINYSRKRTRAMVRGNSPDPIAKTIGDNEYACDFELYLAEFNALQNLLQQLAQQQLVTTTKNGYGDVPFAILATYTANGLDTIVDSVLGGTLDSTDVAQAQGPEALVRKVDCNPLKVLFNGLDDLATPLVAPPGT